MPVLDEDFPLPEFFCKARRDDGESVVVVALGGGDENGETAFDGEARGDDKDVFGKSGVGGVGGLVEDLPGDEHGHDDGLAGAGRHLAAVSGEAAAVALDIDPGLFRGWRLGEPDERFDGLELAEEEGHASPFLVPPVLEEAAGDAGDAGVTGLPPSPDAGPDPVDEEDLVEDAGIIEGAGTLRGDDVARFPPASREVEGAGGPVVVPVAGGFGVGRGDDEAVDGLLRHGLCPRDVQLPLDDGLDAPVIDDLDGDAPLFAGFEGEGDGAAVGLDLLFVDLGLEALLEFCPTVVFPGHGEEDLPGEEAAAVVIGVEHPHGNLLGAAAVDGAVAGVVVIETVDGEEDRAGFRPLGDQVQSDVGLADEPETLVAGAFLLEVVGLEVGVHLDFKEGDTGPVGLVDVLCGFGIELEGGEDEDLGAGDEALRLFECHLDLSGVESGVLRAEGDGDLLLGVVRGLAVGVEPPGAAEGFESGEGDPLAAPAADAGGEELGPPFVLPEGLAGAGGGVVGREGCGGVAGERFDGGGGNGLDGEGAGDADFRIVGHGVVVEGLLRSVSPDALVELGLPLLPGGEELCVGFSCRFRPGGVGVGGDLPLLVGGLRGGVEVSEGAFDIRQVFFINSINIENFRDRPGIDVWRGIIHETACDTFFGVGEVEVVEDGGHETLLCEGYRDAGGVAGDPAPAPPLSDVGSGPGAAGGVEDEVAGVGGHEEATFDDFCSSLHDENFVFGETSDSSVCPNIVVGDVGEIFFISYVLDAVSSNVYSTGLC